MKNMGPRPTARQSQSKTRLVVAPPVREDADDSGDFNACAVASGEDSSQAGSRPSAGHSVPRAQIMPASSEPAPPETLPDALPAARQPGMPPAMLVSLVAHTALLLLLALFSIAEPLSEQRGFDFSASGSAADELPSAEILTLDGQSEAAPPVEDLQPDSRAPVVSIDAPTDEQVSAAISEFLAVDTTLASDPTRATPDRAATSAAQSLATVLDATATRFSATFASTGVEGRQPEQRRELALARGGSIESEAAVELALEWLAAHQLPNGGWSLMHHTGACNGRCANPGSPERFDPAATGLSLLAFLGAGYTHRAGKHQQTVKRGVYFLMQVMEDTPQGGSFLYRSERGMYNHGIAAFALCEAYQLTGDRDLKSAAQRSIDFIVAAQSYQGGWGYLPKQPGDLTLSGWQLMALKSAYAAGLDVPPSTVFRVDPFLDSQQTPSTFFYGYREPGSSPTCTAIALLLRLFRGTPHTDPRILDGAHFFTTRGLSPRDAYYNYYASLFLFHVGEPFFSTWNGPLREHLLRTQSKRGHEAGSWYFEDPYGREGGRLYTTAMAAMTLEVYYRFSPLYQQTDVKFEL